jgi:hypothetical protein
MQLSQSLYRNNQRTSEMPADQPPPSSQRAPNGRFGLGNPGGPGRPRSAVSAAAAALDQAAIEAQRELMNVVLDKARAGDLKAIEMLWARVWPLRRGRPVAFEAPAIGCANDVQATKAAVTEAVLAGEITGHEARPILSVIDAQRDQIRDDMACQMYAEIGEIMHRATLRRLP